MSKLWKKIDILSENYPRFIIDGERCLYARDYVSGGGFEGEANQLILNFKISIDKKNTNRWQHRDNAVKLFAKEIASIIGDQAFNFMAIPGSKPWTHVENNQRFQDLFKELIRLKPNIVVHWPVDCITAVVGSSQGGTRSPAQILANYKWNGFIPGSSFTKIIVIDDVITSGAHYRACSNYLRQNNFTGEIVGVFWAKTKSRDAASDFTIVEE